MITTRLLKHTGALMIALFFSLNAFSHSVQVQYCVSCNGDLRIWIEHWHGTASPSSTTMTISLNINGVTTTQTSAPGGGVVNTPSAALPGCSTPITYVTGCPGDQNTYNDWVFYDFNGLPPGVPITFTIISGNSAFTQDGCNMFPLAVTFTLGTIFGAGIDQNLCEGQASTAIPFALGSSWSNSNPAIGLPATGSGPIPSFLPVGPPGTTSTVSFVNSCDSGSFTYTIMPVPVSGFTVESNGVPALGICEGSTFDFINSSTMVAPYTITDWLWDFGDGNSSTAQDPSHTYAAPGTYNVTLGAVSDSGCVDNFTQVVTVAPFPVVAFTAPDECQNTMTNFTDATVLGAGVINTWQWDLGDGTTSGLQSPTHQYGATGAYTVQLIVTSDLGCVDSVSQVTNVYEVPVANFTPTGGCAVDPATFVDLSTISAGPLTWEWDFGDMSGTSLVQSPSYTYAVGGTYQVELTVESANGCRDSLTLPVTMFDTPIASFTAPDDCYYETTIFTDNSSVGVISWIWDFGDGNTSTATNPTHDYAADGTYNVTLIVDGSGTSCSDTLTQVITRYPQPSADFTTADVCLEDAASFTDLSTINAPGILTGWDWDFGDFTGSTAQNETHLFPTEGTYDVNLLSTSSFGCIHDTTISITIHPMPIPAFTASSVCVNEPSTVFTDASTISSGAIVQWDWLFGDGNSSTLVNPTHEYLSDGNYNAELTLTSDFNCVSSISETVIVFEKPTANFTSSLTKICNPDTIQFTDLSTSASSLIVEWDWDFGTGTTSDEQNPNPLFSNYSELIDYFDIELIATNSYGCKDTMFMADYIAVVPQPVAAFTYSPGMVNVLEPEVTFNNLSDYAVTYDWDFGDGSFPSIEENPIHQYTWDGGEYDVTLIAYSIDNGFCSDTVTQTIVINEVLIYYVPNAFTPDGDAYNNTFQPIFSTGFDPFNYHLSIYNRWGEVIFESYDAEFGWDGTYRNGELAPDGVYTWNIDFKETLTDERHSKQGHFSLIK